MDLQYFHYNTWDKSNRYTVSADIPSKDVILKMLELGTNKLIEVKAGYSLVNPQDNYIKKLGRDISNKRSRTDTYELIQVIFQGQDVLDFHFDKINDLDDRHYISKLVLSVSIKRSRPHFIFADICRNY